MQVKYETFIYYYNSQGSIIFCYSKNGYHSDCTYMGYTLKEAIRKFRKDNNLQHKHIKIKNFIEDKTMKELIIFDSYYDADKYEESRKMLFELYPEENWASPEDIPE